MLVLSTSLFLGTAVKSFVGCFGHPDHGAPDPGTEAARARPPHPSSSARRCSVATCRRRPDGHFTVLLFRRICASAMACAEEILADAAPYKFAKSIFYNTQSAAFNSPSFPQALTTT